MTGFKVDKRDLDFVLYEQFGVDQFGDRFEAFEGMGREDFDMVIESATQFFTKELAPTLREADEEGCKLVDGQVYAPACYEAPYKAYAENGFVAVSQNPEYGGMGLPTALAIALSEIGIGAATSFMFYPGLTVSAGHLIENFASPELRNLLVPKLYSGEWCGTMCLTEPQAGTAVGDVKTLATPIEGSDAYSIKGNKIFISAGDHQFTDNIVHLVLAKVPGDPDGIRGISLFAVPKKRYDAQGNVGEFNDVAVTALEHKMGINGSATCALAFGDNDACEGYLVGERCKGIVYMFQMMNEARMVCGVQGVALGSASYQRALDYAKERTQGPRLTDRSKNPKNTEIINHPDVRRNLMISKAYVEGTRALIFKASVLADIAKHSKDEEERTQSHDLLELLTPICKAYSTDKGFKVSELAIQIHGGYGYIKEYAVEQHMRDLKIASIYEGTNGVQAMDLLGRKMRLKSGGVFLTWLQNINNSIQANAAHPSLSNEFAAVDKAKNALCEIAFGVGQTARKDIELAMLSATPFLEIFGHVEVARLLLEQAVIADQKLSEILGDKGAETPEAITAVLENNPDARFYDGKVKTAKFFAYNILPQAIALTRSIKSQDRSALDIMF